MLKIHNDIYNEKFLKKIDINLINKEILCMQKKYSVESCINYGMKNKENIIINDRLKYWQTIRAKHVIANVKALKKYIPINGNLLDIGSGYGEHISILRHLGFSVTGLLHPYLAEDFILAHKQLKLQLILADIKALPFTDRSFDIVIAQRIITLKSIIRYWKDIVLEIDRITKKTAIIALHDKYNELIKPIDIVKFLSHRDCLIDDNFIIWNT